MSLMRQTHDLGSANTALNGLFPIDSVYSIDLYS